MDMRESTSRSQVAVVVGSSLTESSRRNVVGTRKQRRDSRIPPATSPAVSASMRGNHGRDTGPEILLRLELRRLGLTGYRKNWKAVPGRPDIAFPALKVAVFVHGCFWHRCPRCNLPLPMSNRAYWDDHFRKNQERDARKVLNLRRIGWRVWVVWECELRDDPERYAREVRELVLGSDGSASNARRTVESGRDSKQNRRVGIG